MDFSAPAKATDPDPQASGPEGGALARRNWLAGLWGAELLGLIGHAAHDYALELTHAGEEGVMRRLAEDLRGRVSSTEIRDKLAHLLAEVLAQLHRDKKPKRPPQ